MPDRSKATRADRDCMDLWEEMNVIGEECMHEIRVEGGLEENGGLMNTDQRMNIYESSE